MPHRYWARLPWVRNCQRRVASHCCTKYRTASALGLCRPATNSKSRSIVELWTGRPEYVSSRQNGSVLRLQDRLAVTRRHALPTKFRRHRSQERPQGDAFRLRLFGNSHPAQFVFEREPNRRYIHSVEDHLHSSGGDFNILRSWQCKEESPGIFRGLFELLGPNLNTDNGNNCGVLVLR